METLSIKGAVHLLALRGALLLGRVLVWQFHAVAISVKQE